MFTEALFTIAKTWKQATCTPMDEQIKKTWRIYIYITHTTEYYSTTEKKTS